MKASEHAKVWFTVSTTLNDRVHKLIEKGIPSTAIAPVLATAELAMAVSNAYRAEAENARD